jgi:GNAT superfamily N-acetyltransferase
MPLTISVRDVVPEDYERWLPLWEGYNAFYGRFGPTALPAEVTRTTWMRFFDVYEPVHALVAENDGRLLGLAHYLYHRVTNAIAPTCYLEDLFTIEEARGNGVGRSLILAVYEKARTAGAKNLYWQTHETNATAMRLYDKVTKRAGFVVYEMR